MPDDKPGLEPDAGDDPQTILATLIDVPFWLSPKRELVILTSKDGEGRISGIRIDARLRDESLTARAERALEHIGAYAAVSGVAVLEVTAFAWSRVATGLEWAARKVTVADEADDGPAAVSQVEAEDERITERIKVRSRQIRDGLRGITDRLQEASARLDSVKERLEKREAYVERVLAERGKKDAGG